MPVRIAITKQTATGESVVVDGCQWNPVTGTIDHTVSELKQLITEMLSLADDRANEMNMRVIEAAGIRDYCTPQEWNKILSIFDIIEGRATAHMVAQRWQSSIEETRELEQGRQAAMEAAMLELDLDSETYIKANNFTYNKAEQND